MITEPMKIAMDYTGSSEVLRTALKLKGSPVALAFATSKEEIPAGIPEIDKTIRHCMMVGLARTEGRVFYATAGKHECNGGGWALGLKELTPTLKNGQFYFKLGKFASILFWIPASYIRPKLMGKRVSINPVLMMIGIIGGISIMGVIGLILGPLFIALLVSSYQILISQLTLMKVQAGEPISP
jgi:hypothetical protein